MNKKKWDRAVLKSIELLDKRRAYKWEVVKLALSVCIIKEGNNQSFSKYTLTAFARDIGIAKGTLSKWKMEYQNVILKADIDLNKINKHALNQTMRKVNSNTTKSEVKKIYKSHLKYNTREDKTLTCYVDRLRSMHFFICFGSDLKSLNPEKLKELNKYCLDINKAIKEMQSKRKPRPVKVIKKAAKIIAETEIEVDL